MWFVAGFFCGGFALEVMHVVIEWRRVHLYDEKPFRERYTEE
jgi:hypothetical protein